MIWHEWRRQLTMNHDSKHWRTTVYQFALARRSHRKIALFKFDCQSSHSCSREWLFCSIYFTATTVYQFALATHLKIALFKLIVNQAIRAAEKGFFAPFTEIKWLQSCSILAVVHRVNGYLQIQTAVSIIVYQQEPVTLHTLITLSGLICAVLLVIATGENRWFFNWRTWRQWQSKKREKRMPQQEKHINQNKTASSLLHCFFPDMAIHKRNSRTPKP
jgi:hypothetical protein